MIEDVKKTMKPLLSLIKDLNAEVKAEELNSDTLVKLAATMKMSSLKIEKLIKQNNLSASGGVYVSKEDLEKELED